MRRRILWGLLAVGALSAPPSVARAASLDGLSHQVIDLEARMHSLEGELRPPPRPGPELAARRLVDAQVLYTLKNFEAASIVLYDVVEKYPSSPAYPDALFYLADSLFQEGDYLSAQRYFQKVGGDNPHYAHALERLVEIALHTGDYRQVDDTVRKLEATAQGRSSPAVAYVDGKYRFFREQYDRAIAIMSTIPAGSAYYAQARYFIGAAQVAEAKANHGAGLAEAVATYKALVAQPEKTDVQKQVGELAHLALARIALDQGKLTDAIEEYTKIGPRSPNFNEALYESAWVGIKAKDYRNAARALDLLLISAPDSPRAPEVQLLIGSLRLREQDYSRATERFQKTRDTYAPLHQQLDTEERQRGGAQYFTSLLRRNLFKLDAEPVLPPVALKWVGREPDVARLHALAHSEAGLSKTLDGSSEIIDRLERALAGPARINVFPELATARKRALEISNEDVAAKRELSASQVQLISPVAGADGPALLELDHQRAELEQRLAQLPNTMESMDERLRQARAAYDLVDKQASGVQAQVNAVHASAVAISKYYTDQVAATLPPAQRAQAQREVDGVVAGIGDLQARLDKLRKDVADAEAGVGVDDAEMKAAAQTKAQYDSVLARQRRLSQAIASRLPAQQQREAARIQALLDRAHALDGRVDAFDRRVDAILDEQLKDIFVTLEEEKAHTAAYRATLGGCAQDSADVGGAVLADGLKDTVQRFYNVVVRADVGGIDIAWALKEAATKQDNRLMSERQREVKLLDDEFKEVLKGQP